MKIHFEGKTYDRDVAAKCSSRPGTDCHQELLQMPDGDYFLLVRRISISKTGAESAETESQEVAVRKPSRSIRVQEEIVPLSPLDALHWCLETHVPESLHRYLPEYLRAANHRWA